MDDTIQRILRIKAALARQHQGQAPQPKQQAHKPTVQPLQPKETAPEIPPPVQSDESPQAVTSPKGAEPQTKNIDQS